MHLNQKIETTFYSCPHLDNSVGRESTLNSRDTGNTGSVPGLGRSPAEENHFSTLTWKILRTEEVGRLQSKESQSQT